MTNTGEAALSFKFSTDDLPDLNRASAVREYLSEFMRVEIQSLDSSSPIKYSATLRTVEGASWGSAHPSSILSGRTKDLIKDGQDDILLGMSDSEMVLQVPREGDFLIRPGDAFAISYTREMQLVNRGCGRLRGIRIPHRPIVEAVPNLGSAPMAVIPSRTPTLPLLFQYSALLENDPLIGAATQRMAARHLQEMLALALGASGDFQEQAEENSVTAARLLAVRAEISKHLGNMNYGIRWAAAQQRVTPRHLQRLFAREGTSFSDELRRARLARARAMLEDPSNKNRTISAIALECGYPEASSLNRHFRQEFGMTPGDVRWRR